MSTYESSYKTLLQGVSQQLPSERLPGQLTAQVNMVSDPVTNLRRRPGVTFRKSWAWPDADADHILAWYSDVAGQQVHILLNTNTGNIRILDTEYNELADLDGGAYLTSADPSRIRASAIGNEFYFANCAEQPVLQYSTGGRDPANSAFLYVVAGSFGRTYSVDAVYADGTISASYTTPGGSGAGDAALSTPEYIAQQLATQLAAGVTGGSSDTTVTDVRFVDWVITDAVAGTALQKNVGTATAPTWVNMAPNDELTLVQIANGFVRVYGRGSPEGGFIDINYRVKAGGTWSSTMYAANTVRLPYSAAPRAYGIPVTLFTSTSTPGAPVLVVTRDGPYVFISRSGGISLNTTVGSAYMIASQGGYVTSAGNLPARLPPAADGFICRVGTGTSPQYYEYRHASLEWVETSQYGSPSSITNCPINLRVNESGNWELDTRPFEGRLAGDDVSNPAHEFMQYGITGMGTYQGRLVLMSGPLVSLSASGQPRRFFRSTVTSVLNNDSIEIGSGMTSSAAYEWAVQFQKDLILFSRLYQAVIPSGNAAVTPGSATVVPTSAHEVDTTSSPINLGRTLMFCNPRSEDFFGVMEMIPSQYTDSQYVSQDSTPHLPKYMGGRCRFAVSSGVASMAMFAPSGDANTLVVHEYHWSGDTKDQQAWHQWRFPYAVAQAYFVGDVSVLVFVQNEQVVLGTVDARAGAVNQAGVRRPFLDLNFPVTISANTITLPAWLLAFDPAAASSALAVAGTGSLAGSAIGASPGAPGTLTTVRSWPSGTAVVGIPYYSGAIPTPPQATDYQGDVVHSGKATLLRFTIGTKNSADFEVQVSDAYSTGDPLDEAVLTFSSPELELGRSLTADTEQHVIPCRTDMRSTSLEVSTEGAGELNITSLEYVAKFNPKIKRR